MFRPYTVAVCGALIVCGMSVRLPAQESAPPAAPAPTLSDPTSVVWENPAAPPLQAPDYAAALCRCAPQGTAWVEAEYLLWWMRGASLPPLVTTSPDGTPINQAGVLQTPGAAVLFGNSSVNRDARSGGRGTIGAWLDDDRTLGVEASFLILADEATDFAATSTGSPILARPFIDATTGQQAAQRVAFPGDISGSVRVSATTDGLIGAGILGREALWSGCNFRLDVLCGYRFLRFEDGLNVTENLVSTNPNSPFFIPLGTRIDLFDRFETENSFHGCDLGLAGDLCWGRLTFRFLGKVAYGWNFRTVDIAGATTVTVPGAAPVTNPGGLLALPTNSGTFERNQATAVFELGAKLHYDFNTRLRGWVGYTFLYWIDVLRAGDQANLTINPGLIPPSAGPVAGPLEPALRFQSTGLWIQGLNLGAEFRF